MDEGENAVPGRPGRHRQGRDCSQIYCSRLLEMLDLSGAVVTIDAIGCRRSVAQRITQCGAGCALALKDNHRRLPEDVRVRPDSEQRARCLSVHETVEKDITIDANGAAGLLPTAIGGVPRPPRQIQAIQPLALAAGGVASVPATGALALGAMAALVALPPPRWGVGAGKQRVNTCIERTRIDLNHRCPPGPWAGGGILGAGSGMVAA